jgi:threonine dehydrogenase-like Zn-dependent dehydrogenase
MRFSGISRGTESLVFHGRVPPSQHDAMRGPHQRGAFPFPVQYGYMAVGTVQTGPMRGTDVFCLHPHQDWFVVDESLLAPLPEALPAHRAILTANMETALNGVWDAGIGPGDRVTVVGAGVVGTLVAWLASRIPATQVTLVDILPQRASLARTLGIDFSLPDDAPGDQDQVVHASGHPNGLNTALRCAGVESTVLEMSWYGDRPVPALLGGAFHSRRLRLRSSQVGRIPPHRAPRWSFSRRLTAAMTLLEDPILDHLIDGESPFSELPATMARVTGQPGSLCHRVVYPGAQ